MSKIFTSESVFHSMLRTVELCSIKKNNIHVAHLLLYRPEFEDYILYDDMMTSSAGTIPCFALSLTCVNKVLKMINAIALYCQQKLSHYSSYTLHDALIITTELGKTVY